MTQITTKGLVRILGTFAITGLACLVLPSLAPAQLPTIWIVDASNGPGTNFTDLPAAVSAAASGDTIIVRSGAYTAFDVSGKALTILGAGTTSTSVNLGLPLASNSTRIQGVPPGTTFYISGISFAPPAPSGAHALQILGNAGAVVLSSVGAGGALFPWGGTAGSGLVVGGSEVHASQSTFHGGGNPTSGGGGVGALISGVFVADDCTFHGGSAVTPYYGVGGEGLRLSGFATLAHCSGTGGPGAAGASVFGGFLRVSGTSSDSFVAGYSGQPPGTSAVAVSAGSAIIHGAVILTPSGNASPTSGAVTTGAPLLPYVSFTGTPDAAGDLLANQPVTLTLAGGLPLAPFVLAVDFVPAFNTAYAPALLGELLVPIPPASFLEGTLDALGMFQLAATPSVAFPALVGIPLHLQFGALDSAAANVRMSNGLIRRFQ